MRYIYIILSIMLLQACTYFTPPKEDPVIEDRLGREPPERLFGTLAVTPERRVIFAKFENGRFCAEPPPDVAENITSAFTSAIKASVEKEDVSAGAQAELAKEFMTTVDQIFKRTQGIQLFRDYTYALCQAYANEILTEAEFMEKYDDILEVSARLVELELAKIPSLDTQEAKQAAEQAQQSLRQAQMAMKDAKQAQKKAEAVAEELKTKTTEAE